MVRITWTHGYDLLFRLASLFGLVMGIGLIADAKEWTGWIPGVLIITVMLLILEPYNWVLAWLYVRHHLGVSLTQAEAKEVEFLFNGSADGKWYKLKVMPALSLEQRKHYLFQLAVRVAREKGYVEPKFSATPVPPPVSSAAPRFAFEPPVKPPSDRKAAASFCHRCGNSLAQDAEFCSTCGVKIPNRGPQ